MSIVIGGTGCGKSTQAFRKDDAMTSLKPIRSMVLLIGLLTRAAGTYFACERPSKERPTAMLPKLYPRVGCCFDCSRLEFRMSCWKVPQFIIQQARSIRVVQLLGTNLRGNDKSLAPLCVCHEFLFNGSDFARRTRARGLDGVASSAAAGQSGLRWGLMLANLTPTDLQMAVLLVLLTETPASTKPPQFKVLLLMKLGKHMH